MSALFWWKTIFENGLGYEKVTKNLSQDESTSHIVCTSSLADMPDFFILIFYECSSFSEKEDLEFKAFQKQMIAERNIERGFWVMEQHSNENTVMYPSELITKTIKLLDEENQYEFLGLLAIEFYKNQKHWLNFADIKQLILNSPFYSTDAQLLKSLKKCPFLICHTENNFQFSYQDFEWYYVAMEFNKFQHTNYKEKFEKPFHYGLIQFVDFNSIFLRNPKIRNLWEKIESEMEKLSNTAKYGNVVKLRDYRYAFFHNYIQSNWYDFNIANLDEAENELNSFLLDLEY